MGWRNVTKLTVSKNQKSLIPISLYVICMHLYDKNEHLNFKLPMGKLAAIVIPLPTTSTKLKSHRPIDLFVISMVLCGKNQPFRRDCFRWSRINIVGVKDVFVSEFFSNLVLNILKCPQFLKKDFCPNCLLALYMGVSSRKRKGSIDPLGPEWESFKKLKLVFLILMGYKYYNKLFEILSINTLSSINNGFHIFIL